MHGIPTCRISNDNRGSHYMGFARKVWHLLVAVKDGLSLVFLLLFFGLLYVVLTARPSPAGRP